MTDAQDALAHGASIPAAVWRPSVNAFLEGAVVSPAFAIRGDDAEYELIYEWDPSDWGQPIWDDGEVAIRPLLGYEPASVVMTKSGRRGGAVLGFNTDGHTYVDPSLRGNGYGAALVIALAVEKRGRPFPTPAMGYSAAGYAAHVAAHRMAREWAIAKGLATVSNPAKPAGPIRANAKMQGIR